MAVPVLRWRVMWAAAAAVVTIAACGDSAIPAPGDEVVPTSTVASPSTVTSIGGATGTLRITQFRTACCYIEGSVAFLSIAGPNDAVLTDRSYRPIEDRQVLYSAALPVGRYNVVSYQRPCDGNCDHLSAPTDRCTGSFDVAQGQTTPVVVRFAPSKGCTMQIDEAVASKLPDEIALAGELTDCGIDYSSVPMGRSGPARQCFVAAYDARKAAQVTTYNRGPDTGEGNDQQIVRVDTARQIIVYRRILGPGRNESPWTKQTCTGLKPDKEAGYILTGCTPFAPLT
jgi:hypothetical protein